MITSHQRGHAIEYALDKKLWLFSDDKTSIITERPCVKCGGLPTREGYDACLGHITNVKSACCGHGIESPIMIMESR